MNITVHYGFDACVSQKLLQNLGLHTAFDCSCSISVAQGMHAKTLDACLVAELIEVGTVRTVLDDSSVCQLMKARSRMTSLDVTLVRLSMYSSVSESDGDSMLPFPQALTLRFFHIVEFFSAQWRKNTLLHYNYNT